VVVAASSASIPGIQDFCVVTCEGLGPTLQWRICLRALVGDLSYDLIGCREPYLLDRGSSRAMTSVLHDAGFGVDGGYPSDLNVSIHRGALRVLDGQNRSSWAPQLDRQPDESANHSMKEKQQ
jgi:hypothetical protein